MNQAYVGPIQLGCLLVLPLHTSREGTPNRRKLWHCAAGAEVCRGNLGQEGLDPILVEG